MTHSRSIPLAAVLVAASLLMACTTPPDMPMSAASANNMPVPGQMEKMDTQMKAMREMHAKMMAAKTPEERKSLMVDHGKAMEQGMDMMSKMDSAGGMGDMKGMGGMVANSKEKGAAMGMMDMHKMMLKRMEMMTSMMQMMMDRLPASTAP